MKITRVGNGAMAGWPHGGYILLGIACFDHVPLAAAICWYKSIAALSQNRIIHVKVHGLRIQIDTDTIAILDPRQ